MTPAELARMLDQPDAELRRRAVMAMADSSDPATGGLLLRALGDRDWRVREEAIRVGQTLAERLGLIAELVSALSQGDNVGLRNAALALLKTLGRAAHGPLTAALPRFDPGARKLVIEALGHGGSSQALRMLADAVGSDDPNIVAAAIEALADMGGADAEAVLRGKLRASSVFERIAALDALCRLEAVIPWEELEPLTTDRLVLRVAVPALGRSGRREAIEPLFEALTDRSDAVATAAAVGLSRLSESEPLAIELRSRLRSAGQAVRGRLAALAAKGAGPLLPAEQAALQRVMAFSEVPEPPNATGTAVLFGTRAPQLAADEFRAIADRIRRVSGIRLAEELRSSVERKLGDRVVALGLRSFGEYYRRLAADAPDNAELERAIELVTTNETYFFRDLPQLASFQREVLPELRRLNASRRTLTLWSAGCSTGEEAHTIAILIARSGLFSGWNVRVFGNDISRRVVQAARRGVYRGASFRALPSEYERHFIKSSEGWGIDPEIQAMCHFACFNLLDATSATMFGRVDAIFCRNVLIYFDDEARRRVIETFYQRLQPGGYLMLGHSDSLLPFATAFELAQLSGDLAYRKPLNADRTG